MTSDKKNTLDVLKEIGLSGQIYGQGEQLVICLHGWLDNSDSFKPMLEFVDEDKNFTWIAIDLPGHGRSQWRSHDAHYYFIDYVYDLKLLLEKLRCEKVMLVGHSMGAMVCNLFAACYPGNVLAMALIDGIGIVTTKPSESKQQLINAFRQRSKAQQQSNTKLFSNFEEVVAARLKVSDLEYENAALLMRRNVEILPEGVKLTTDPRLKQHSGFRFSAAQALACLENIEVPTLFLKASNGYPMIEQQLKVFEKCFTQFKVVLINGGHHCHMENASESLQSISFHFDAYNET